MCDIKIVKFEEAAFLAGVDCEGSDVALINALGSFCTGNANVAPVEGYMFRQFTDTVSPEQAARLLRRDDLEVVEATPEKLLESGFSEQAIVNGLRAARRIPYEPIPNAES